MILEDFKKIELVTEDVDGIEVPPQFLITYKDKKTATIPAIIENVHYREVREWYNQQKKPPFKFDFLPDPEPGKTLPVYDQDNPRAAQPTVSADQTEDADLPDLNLTKKQQSELSGS